MASSQANPSEESLHINPSEERLHANPLEETLPVRSSEESLQVNPSKELLQTDTTEESLQESSAKAQDDISEQAGDPRLTTPWSELKTWDECPGHDVLPDETQGPWVTGEQLDALIEVHKSHIEYQPRSDAFTRALIDFLLETSTEELGQPQYNKEPATKEEPADDFLEFDAEYGISIEKAQKLIGRAFYKTENSASVSWMVEVPLYINTCSIEVDRDTLADWLWKTLIFEKLVFVGPGLDGSFTGCGEYFVNADAYYATLNSFWEAYFLLLHWVRKMEAEGKVIPLVTYLRGATMSDLG
ncbi:hypothetical protein F5B20DRAFT_582567 [Whalleya microplaca]|nr:hypothetical protein F5B20DRAFT_582567 [Whalleya microplaca]